MSGIYMIRCTANGRYYIGGTTHSFETRFAQHKSQLARGRSGCRLLQACHDLHGAESLEYIPLKEFPDYEVHAREQEAIETLRPDLNIYGCSRFEQSGRHPLSHDVGGGRRMTVAAIAKETGLHEDTVRYRLAAGLRGEALFARKYRAPRKDYTYRK